MIVERVYIGPPSAKYRNRGDIMIYDLFLPSETWQDGTTETRSIAQMTDDEILDALKLAGQVGKELEAEGYKVIY